MNNTPEVRVYENCYDKIFLASDGFFFGKEMKSTEEIVHDLKDKKYFSENATYF